MADNWQLKAVISANASGMLGALKQVNAMSKDTRKYLLDVANSAGKLSGKVGLPLAAISGILGGFSIAAIKGAVVGFASMGEAIYKGSLKAGMSVEQYQRMKYVAEQAGVGVESLEGGIGKLNLKMSMAAAGKNKDVVSLFAKLGITARDTNGQLKSGMDVLPQLADAFMRNKNPLAQAHMGMALFGKSWQEMIPLLMQGAAGIQESQDRMKRFKGVMGPEEIKGAVEFSKTLKDTDMVMKGFSMTIAKALVPVIQPLLDDLNGWLAVNKKLVSTEVGKMAKDLGAWIKTIDFGALARDVQSTFASFGKFIDFVGGAKNALIGLVIFMNLQTLMAFGGLIAAVGRLGWAFTLFALKNIPKLLLGLGLIEAPAIVAAGALDGVALSAGAANTAALGFVGTLKNMLAIVTPLALALAPLAAMWGVTKWAEDTSHDKERVQGIQDTVAKPATSMLSWFGIDKDADYAARRAKNREGLTSPYSAGSATTSAALAAAAQAPALAPAAPAPAPATFNNRAPQAPWLSPNADRPSLAAPQARGRVDGQVNINITGLPPGSRVEQAAGAGNMPLNLNVGYRSDALGLP